MNFPTNGITLENQTVWNIEDMIKLLIQYEGVKSYKMSIYCENILKGYYNIAEDGLITLFDFVK